MCDQSMKFVNNLYQLDQDYIFALSLKIVYRVNKDSILFHPCYWSIFITSTKGAVTSEFSRRGEAQLGMSTNLHK
jgi:hypothetical protein